MTLPRPLEVATYLADVSRLWVDARIGSDKRAASRDRAHLERLADEVAALEDEAGAPLYV